MEKHVEDVLYLIFTEVTMDFPSLKELEDNLQDINHEEVIPEDVRTVFWALKEVKGTLPMGISYLEGRGWYVVSPSVLENNGYLHRNKGHR